MRAKDLAAQLLQHPEAEVIMEYRSLDFQRSFNEVEVQGPAKLIKETVFNQYGTSNGITPQDEIECLILNIKL